MKNVPSIKGNATPKTEGTQSALDAFQQIVSAWKEYEITKEVEETKRAQIEAWRIATIKRLDHQKTLLQLYLKETFKERRAVIEGMFDKLDQGIEKGDNQLVSMSMQSIISTVQASPLQGVQQIMAQIEDNNNDAIEI